MITAVSHVVLGADDVDRAVVDYERVLGQGAKRFAERDGRVLHRFQLSNIALEISAVGDRPAGLQGIAFEAEDIAATSRKLGRRGLACGAACSERWISPEGGVIERKLVPLATAATHGVGISIVETMASADGRPAAIVPSAVTAIDHLVIRSPNPERAVALYGGRLGLDFALDRTNPEWGSRLLFFGCGGVRVEIGHALNKGVSDEPDALSGLAWRVADAAEAEHRLRAAGVQTSDAKKGRRPGSQVLTVRSSTCNVPTLFLSETPRDEVVI